MKLRTLGSSSFLLGGLLFLSCGRGPSTTPLSPSTADNPWKGTGKSTTPLGSAPDSGSQGMAAGDVQNGPIEIHEVRIRRGAPGSQVDVHPNALAGTVVRVPSLGQEIELWVTWSASPLPVAPPRLVIDFGDGFKDNISCGSCLLHHAYSQDGRYTVKVLMDDRVGGTTTRTFVMDVYAAICGKSVAANFDSYPNGTAGSALGIAGLSAPAALQIQSSFSANTSGKILIAFVGLGDIDLTFTDDQGAVQFDYAYQSGFPSNLTVYDGSGQQIQSTPAVGVFDGSISDVGHISLSSSRGIRRVVLGNGSNGVLIDNLQTTATCAF